MKTYIQIGSNVGNDLFQKEIETLIDPSFIILIEPNITLFEQLKSNYEKLINKHKIIFCDKAIALKQQKTKLYMYWENQLSTLINRKSLQQPLQEMIVESISFNDLCKLYNIEEIELLQIDTEGLDYEIINSIDFSQIQINTLIFEEWGHRDDDLNGEFRTGADFLDAQLKDQLLSIYDWGNGIWTDGMHNFKLTLKDSCKRLLD